MADVLKVDGAEAGHQQWQGIAADLWRNGDSRSAERNPPPAATGDTKVEYDSNGNISSVEMQNGWKFTRGADGNYEGVGPNGERVSWIKEMQVGKDGAVTYQSSNDFGGRDHVFLRTDGQALTASYDGAGELMSVQLPGEREMRIARDSAGNYTRSWLAPDGKRYFEPVVDVTVYDNGSVSWSTIDRHNDLLWRRTVTLDGKDDGGIPRPLPAYLKYKLD